MRKYGSKEDGANVILGACDFQMVFRLNDNESAKWMSNRIGVVDRIVESKVTSDDRTLFSTATITHSKSIVTEPKIFPHELQQLKNG